MAFAFNKQFEEWSTVQQLFVLGKISEGETHHAIYNELTAESSEVRPIECGRWQGSFSAFRKRLQRLTKTGIDPAINTDTGQKFDFDLGTSKGRYDYWMWLAQTTTSTATRVQALTMVEKLAPQFQDEDDEFGNMTYAEVVKGGREILNDWSQFKEVVNTQLALSISEGFAVKVADAIAEWVLDNPKVVDDVASQLLEAYPKLRLLPETNEAKIIRMLSEFRTLSEKDQADMLARAAFVDGDKGGVMPGTEDDEKENTDAKD